MHIRMTEEARGSNDGHTTRTFKPGNTYDVTERLGRSFLEMGVAERVTRKPADPNEVETKPASPVETKPAAPDETKEDDEVFLVEKEPTKEGSPYYQFRVVETGELVTYGEEEDPVKVLGEEKAEKKRKELEEQHAPDDGPDVSEEQ